MLTKRPKTPKNLLEETVVVINTDLPTAILRLQELNGRGRDTDTNDRGLLFFSNRKGRFTIAEATRNRYEVAARAVGLQGGLYVEDGKTKAVVYTYRPGSTVLGMILEVLAGLVMLAVSLLYSISLLQTEFSSRTLLVSALLMAISIAFPVHGVIRMKRGKRGRESDADILKQDALRRMTAINQWDK